MEDVKKYQIRLNKIGESSIVRSDGVIANTYDKDFYITVSIFKKNKVEGYVNVDVDPLRLVVERQFINPYFIELGFFEDIDSVLSQNSNNNNSVQEKAEKYGITINR
jgi:hypothetical protein